MENRGQVEDRIHQIKKKIVAFFVAGLMLLDFGICLLALGWPSILAVVTSIVVIVFGATPALIATYILNRRKNAWTDSNGSRPRSPPPRTRR